MKPNKYEATFKEFLGMQKRKEELRKILSTLPPVPLDKPYQRGWDVFVGLRDDVLNRDDSFDIQMAIDIGYNRGGRVKKVEDVKNIRKGEKGYYKKEGKQRVWVSYYPQLKLISEKEYELIPSAIHKFFMLDTLSDRYKLWGHKFYVLNLPSYYTVLKVKPHMVTHVYTKDGELESEKEFLDQKLDKFYREYFGGYGSFAPIKTKLRKKDKNNIKRFMLGIDEDLYHEKFGKQYD